MVRFTVCYLLIISILQRFYFKFQYMDSTDFYKSLLFWNRNNYLQF